MDDVERLAARLAIGDLEKILEGRRRDLAAQVVAVTGDSAAIAAALKTHSDEVVAEFRAALARRLAELKRT